MGPYTDERRDVLEITPPEDREICRSIDFAPRGPRDCPRAKPKGNLQGRGMQNQCCGKSRGPRVGIFQWIPTLVILSSLLPISCQCLIWIVCTNIRVQFELKLNNVEESFLKSLPDISFRTPGNRLGGINCQWQDDSKLWLSFVKFQSQVNIRTLMAWSGWELSGAVKTINYVEWNGIANLFLWQRWENSVERNF